MTDYTNYEIRFNNIDVNYFEEGANDTVYEILQKYIEKDFKDFLKPYYIHKQALEDLTVTVKKRHSEILFCMYSKRDNWSFAYKACSIYDLWEIANKYFSLLLTLKKTYYAYYQIAYAKEMREVNNELVKCFGKLLSSNAKRVPNFCTYCGAVLNKETHNCDYCGALYTLD